MAKATTPVTPEAVEKPVTAAASTKQIDKAIKSDIDKIKKSLEAQPQVQFIIPLAMGEKMGAAEVVAINGYRVTVRKGTLVTVPQQVAEILAEHYRIEADPGSAKRLDLSSPEAQQALN